MDRRTYISIAGTTGLTSVAGCAGTLEPRPVFEAETTPTAPANEDIPLSDEEAEAVGERTQPGVVKILDASGRGVGGTGWFLDETTVVTNAHIVLRGSSFQVETFAGDTYETTQLGAVESMQPDVAALTIDPPEADSATTLATGDSSALERGDPLIQVGHPGSVGWWAISLGAYLSQHEAHPWFLSTTPTLRGNSGSPVFTSDGAVVGLTSGETWAADAMTDYRDVENTVFRRYPSNTRTTHVPIETVQTTISEWR